MGYFILNNREISILIESKLVEIFKLNNLDTKQTQNSQNNERKINGELLKTWQCKIAPWEKLKIDANLNLIIEEFLEALMENYVHSW